MKRQTILRNGLLTALLATGAVASLALSTAVRAQSANANLRGTAPAGAQITARNVATGQVRTTTASASGSYVLIGLPPGTWRVNAGAGAAQTVTLQVASTSTLDLAAAAAPASGKAPIQTLQAVTVVGRPLLDVKTSQVGEIVSQHQIETQPQVTRNFLEFADTVPGMIFTINTNGNTSLQSGAQNSDAVNVYIDGVSQKSYVMGGGVAGQFATQGNPFPQMAVGQYRVITSNYKAEYGQLSSAAVTAVTKTGTNQFHGEVYDNYTDSSYRDMTPAEKHAGKKAQSESREYGFALGGPIIKNRMHFFITDSQKRFDTPVAVTPGVTSPDVTGLLPQTAQAAFGPASNPFVENLFFGDMDWEITGSDRLLLRAQLRRETQDSNIGDQTAASAGIGVRNNVKQYDLEWDHSADAWYNKFLLLYQRAFYEPEGLYSSGVGQVFTYGPNNNQLILQTGAPSPLAFQNKGQKGPGFKDDLTFSDLHWLGDHTVQMGVRYQDLTLIAQDSGNATAQAYFNVCPLGSTDPNCPAGTGADPYKAFFSSPAADVSPMVRTKDKQIGAYIQDDWAVNDHLTLNLGVRWDLERNSSYLNWVTPANVVAAINSQYPGAPAGETYAQALALGGININDFIANGHDRHADKGAWQPRLGFSYDLNGDQKHVFFGGAGRAYNRNLYNYLQLEQTKLSLGQFTYYFSSPNQPCLGQPCVPWDPSKYDTVAGLQTLASPTPGAGEVDMFTNNLKQPYSDQFSLGMRNKFGDWNTSLSVVRVVSHDGLAASLDDRAPDGAFFVNGNTDFGNPIPGLGNLILWTNGIETRSTQVLLYATKPYTPESHWGVTIAYTHTNADHNRDITNGPYSFDEPTIQDYPFIISNEAPKQRIVMTGVMDGPWGLTFSTKVTLATPTPYNTNVCYIAQAFFPNGSRCTPAGGMPTGGKRFFIGGPMWGYRDVDFAVIKNFRIIPKVDMYLRLDVLNAFNYKNLVDFNFYSDATFNNVGATYNPFGDIIGVPRTFKFTAGVKW